MILPRFLTALLGVPLLLAAIWWGQVPFFLLFFGVIMLSLYEFYTLLEEASWPVSKKTGLALGAILSFSIFLFGTRLAPLPQARLDSPFLPVIVSAVLIWPAVAALFGKDKENATLSVALTLLGIFYVVWNLSHLLLIRDLRPDGRAYTFFLFLLVWALDTAAYGGGRRWGRTKLAESVSPMKTWEGAAVGTAACLFVAWICQATFLTGMKPAQVFLLALATALIAQLSDLSESLFKRNVRVKDSGTLLPGHGGILDRFDSFLFASPVFYYLLMFFVRP